MTQERQRWRLAQMPALRTVALSLWTLRQDVEIASLCSLRAAMKATCMRRDGARAGLNDVREGMDACAEERRKLAMRIRAHAAYRGSS